MIRREGRLANPQVEPGSQAMAARPVSMVDQHLTRPVLLGLVLVALVLGGIFGLNALIGLAR